MQFHWFTISAVFILAGLTGLYHTFQALVSLRPPGAPLRWAALTEVKVTLVIIQGVVLRANTRGLGALWVVILKAMIRVCGLLCGWRRMRFHRFGSCHYLVILGRAGGQRDLRSDMWAGLLGVLVFWLLRGLGFNAVCCVECNHGNNDKYQLTGSPHGSLGSGDKDQTVFIRILTRYTIYILSVISPLFGCPT